MNLYLHIPYCHRVCPYCSFYKHTPGKSDIARFIDAVLVEAQSASDLFAKHGSPASLYLGGGTPSMLSPSHLKKLFGGLQQCIDLSNSHITMEANPATFSDAKAELFNELGINRVSLGIQSFTPHVLKTLGREHSRQQAIDSVHTLQKAGIQEINIDLMFSIPGQSLTDWQETLDLAVSLEPHHISAYNLTYEEDTEFIAKFQRGEYQQTEDDNAKQFLAAHHTLTSAGFEHYETSNYAQPSHRSSHNLSYWQGHDYLGLGPSAVSTINAQRWKNLPDTAGYIHAIETIGHAKREIENLDPDAFRTERIALLLRTADGLPLHYLKTTPEQEIQTLIDEDLAQKTATHLHLTLAGSLLVDPIAERLI